MYRFGDRISSNIYGFAEEKTLENYVNNGVLSMSAIFYPNGDGGTFWYPLRVLFRFHFGCISGALELALGPWGTLGEVLEVSETGLEVDGISSIIQGGSRIPHTLKAGGDKTANQLPATSRFETTKRLLAYRLPATAERRPTNGYSPGSHSEITGTEDTGLLSTPAACGTLQAGAGGFFGPGPIGPK